MKLYHAPGACSLAVHIVARELGLSLDMERVDTRTHRTEHGADFYTINPKGYVPLLQLDDGERLTEGPVIVQYLADRAGDTRLMPAAGTMARYRVMEWQHFIGTELHKTFVPLFGGPSSLGAEADALVRDRVTRRLAWVDGQLEGREYLVGTEFTAADAYLFVMTMWARFLKVDVAGMKHLGAHAARVGARPAVVAAMQAEGLA